jgi:hypothetical protein
MAAGSTYTPIATTTLGSATTEYTFSSIPSTYTDLVLIANNYFTSGGTTLRVRFNGDTGSNYSWTLVQGNGSSAGSVRGSNDTKLDAFGWNTNATSTNSGTVGTMSVMNYSNTTTNKTAIARHNWVSGEAVAFVGLWRNTAAITSLTLTTTNAQTIGAGTVFTLYGIAAA